MQLLFLNTWHSELKTELRNYIKEVYQDIDIFCFQEASIDEQSVYADLLSGYNRYFEEKPQDDLFLGNVIFVKKGIEVIRNGSLLAKGSNIGLANYVVIKQGGTETAICNVHGVAQPGHKLDTPERLQQSQVLIDFFADARRAIIGGDFNLLPETKSVGLFEENGYRNLIKDFAITSTRNHIAHAKYPDNPQYYADYLFTSQGVGVTSFEVPSDVISDHQALRVSVQSTASLLQLIAEADLQSV